MHVLALLGAACFCIFGHSFSMDLHHSACELEALYFDSLKVYTESLSAFPLDHYYDANITTLSRIRNQVNVVQSMSAAKILQTTVTLLQSTTNSTKATAPVFTPTNTKFYCYDKKSGHSLELLLSNVLADINAILHVSLDTKMRAWMNDVDMHVLEASAHADTQRVVASIGADKESTLRFITTDLLSLSDDYTKMSQSMYGSNFFYTALLLGLMPVLACFCGVCGMCGLHRGGFEHSELLDGWDTHAGKFTATRQVLHLDGCVAKTGSRCNAFSWCCALLYGSIFFLLGGILLIFNGVGNDTCTSLPILVSDLPLYIPATLPGSSDSISNAAINNGLLSTCLQGASTNHLNFSRLGFLLVKQQHLQMGNLLANLTQIELRLQRMEQLDSSCFWSSQLTKYTKISPLAQYIDLNQTSVGSTDENSYRQQDRYIHSALSKIQSNMNLTAIRSSIKVLRHTFTAVEQMESKFINPLQLSLNRTQVGEKCEKIYNSLEQFKTVTCASAIPLMCLMGFSLLLSGIVSSPICCSTLVVQRRWGGHGAIPVSNSRPSEQHRMSHFHLGGISHDEGNHQTIEMEDNPMGTKKQSVVHDLHGPMKVVSWM